MSGPAGDGPAGLAASVAGDGPIAPTDRVADSGLGQISGTLSGTTDPTQEPERLCGNWSAYPILEQLLHTDGHDRTAENMDTEYNSNMDRAPGRVGVITQSPLNTSATSIVRILHTSNVC